MTLTPLDELRSRGAGLVANIICPFCQRVQLMLFETGLEHTRIELDFTDKPPWLLELSPEGKIPVLVSGDHAIFESRAIVEYLNDRAGGKYLPADLEIRAIARSWCQSIEHLHDEVRRYFTAATDAVLEESYQKLLSRLGLLLERCPAELLDPVQVTLVGVHLAVLFNLLSALSVGPHEFFPEGSRLATLRDAWFRRDGVQRINSEEYRTRLLRFVGAKPTAFAQSSAVQQALSTRPASSTERNAAEYLERKATG